MISYRIFYFLNWLITLLPLRILYIFSDIFFLFTYYIIGYRKKVILKNLRNAFPEKSEAEIKSIRKKFNRHLGDVFVETLKSVHISEKQTKKRVRFRNPEVFMNLYEEGKSVISVCGHYGNWEWFHGLPFISNHQAMAIFKEMKNKYFEGFVNDLRGKFGLIPVEMKHSFKSLATFKAQGILTNILVVADQIPSKRDFWTTFLNQETAVFLGAEKIAKKLDQAVVFLKVYKPKRGYYEIEIIPITNDAKSEPDFDITRKHVSLLEQTIIERPELWLWSHKRWKHKKPENEPLH